MRILSFTANQKQFCRTFCQLNPSRTPKTDPVGTRSFRFPCLFQGCFHMWCFRPHSVSWIPPFPPAMPCLHCSGIHVCFQKIAKLLQNTPATDHHRSLLCTASSCRKKKSRQFPIDNERLFPIYNESRVKVALEDSSTTFNIIQLFIPLWFQLLFQLLYLFCISIFGPLSEYLGATPFRARHLIHRRRRWAEPRIFITSSQIGRKNRADRKLRPSFMVPICSHSLNRTIQPNLEKSKIPNWSVHRRQSHWRESLAGGMVFGEHDTCNMSADSWIKLPLKAVR